MHRANKYSRFDDFISWYPLLYLHCVASLASYEVDDATHARQDMLMTLLVVLMSRYLVSRYKRMHMCGFTKST